MAREAHSDLGRPKRRERAGRQRARDPKAKRSELGLADCTLKDTEGILPYD
jgi:hypothetical protein